MGGEKIERKENGRFSISWDWRGKTLIIEIIALFLLLISLIAFAWKRVFFVNTPIESDVWGQLGDFVGGIIGTLIAYISVRLLIKTLTIQIQANQETSRVNSKTSEIYELQQFNEMFKTLFNLYKGIKNTYKLAECSPGHESLSQLINELKQENVDNFAKKEDYHILNEKAIKVYEGFYSRKCDIVSVHFRLLYRIFKLIHSARISDANRTIVSKTVRCQLTEEELFLLRYNAMSKCGEKMQLYVNQYNLLKHLPILNTLEFYTFANKMDKTDINCINVELQRLTKNIRTLFLNSSDSGKMINMKLSDNSKYSLKIKVTPDNKAFNLELTKDNKTKLLKDSPNSIIQALDKLNIESLKDLLLFYIQELFIYSNFQMFCKKDELLIENEISSQTNSKKNIISVNVKNKNGYPLICCKAQLDNPQ